MNIRGVQIGSGILSGSVFGDLVRGEITFGGLLVDVIAIIAIVISLCISSK